MRILVTGAAGQIGSEVAAALLDRGHCVIGLVHREHNVLRRDGCAIPYVWWNGQPPPQAHIALLRGDVAQAGIGLSVEMQGAIMCDLDVIVHAAAVTDLVASTDAYMKVNVHGTQNVLSLATAGKPAPGIVHVSTAFVCGDRTGSIKENTLGDRFANGYEASKAAAERIVIRARSEGMRIAVARPSIVVGATEDGGIRDFSGIYLLFRMLAKGRLRNLPVVPSAALNLVPIDYAANAIVDIAERIERIAGKNFHIVAETPASLDDIRNVMRDYPGFSVPNFVPAESFRLSDLEDSERQLHQSVVGLYAKYLARDQRFQTQNTRSLLRAKCPDIGRAYIRRLIDYCLDAGFLSATNPARALQRTSG